MLVLPILVLLFVGLSQGSKCNVQDRLVYKQIGETFPSKFRSFGGWSVSKSSFESSVREYAGLSKPCSECFGDAYICGYNNCFWSCSSAGETCNRCLIEEKCTENVNKCTGF